MKDVLTVVTFFMGALCFVMFLIRVKPAAPIEVSGPSRPATAHLRPTVRPVAVANPKDWRVARTGPAEPSNDKHRNEVTYECDVGRDQI